jgi:rhamnogalacturonyl hydrolase YesR
LKEYKWMAWSLLLMFFILPNGAWSETDTMLTEEKKKEFYDAAMLVADWMESNQNDRIQSADHGRFVAALEVADPEDPYYSCNWMTGAAMMGMLMAYHRTGEAKYLEAAGRGGQYLLTLQILDPRESRFEGAFREDTPQYTWCYPRDGLTAAWALLWLYEETGEEEFLYRVNLFNQWFLEQAMKKGWPAWEFYFHDKEPVYLQGSFHGGDGAYFYDYYRVTGDDSLSERGLRFIADYSMEKFVMPDGEVKVIYDAEAGKYIEDGTTFDGMQKMHRHNDDFMSITLLAAYARWGEQKYLDRAEAYARWLISEQRPDGGFGNPDVPPAAATGPNVLADLYRITGKKEYLEAAVKGAEYLLTQQETESDDPRLKGGFYGYGGGWSVGSRSTLNIRTSAYALIALLKLEGVEQGPYYSVLGRDGKMEQGEK